MVESGQSTADHEEARNDLLKFLHDEYISAGQAEGTDNPICEAQSEVIDFYYEAGWRYVEDVSRCHVDRTLVEKARKLEWGKINKICLGSGGHTCESRLVATESRTSTTGDLFAGMPPLRAINMPLALCHGCSARLQSGSFECRVLEF